MRLELAVQLLAFRNDSALPRFFFFFFLGIFLPLCAHLANISLDMLTSFALVAGKLLWHNEKVSYGL